MEILVSRIVNPFQSPKKTLGTLNADVVARLISSAADVALVVDKNGVIRDVAIGSEDLSKAGLGAWVGVPWMDTVTSDSRHKVEELMREAALKRPTRWREVNHMATGGGYVPVRYSALQVREDGRVVAFGRDLRALASLQQQLVDAQMSIERDYARLRQTELRYRLLFQIASEAIIIADATTARITEVNPAALALIGEPSKKIAAQTLLELIDPADGPALQDLLATVRSTGAGESIPVRLAGLRSQVHFFRVFLPAGQQRIHPGQAFARRNTDARRGAESERVPRQNHGGAAGRVRRHGSGCANSHGQYRIFGFCPAFEPGTGARAAA